MQNYRVNPTRIASVRHPEHGGYVAPENNRTYPADDPLVRAYPWMFETDEEAAKREATPPPESVPVVIEPPIERGTKAPGERRVVRRPAK